MARFDFVEAVSKAYRFMWGQRRDVLRLAAMALTLKILTFVAFVVFGLEDQILRHGLYLLPAYLLEGWVVAQLMLMALHYDLAHQKRGNTALPLPPAEDVERNIKASMIVYVLTKLALSFVVGMTFAGQPALPQTPPPEQSTHMLILAIMMLVFAIWSFRFFWLYVPLVIGRTPMEFLLRFKAFSASFPLIGVWVLCMVPMMLLMIVFSQVFQVVLGGLGLGDTPLVFESVMAALQAVIDTLLALVSSVAVAYGIYAVLNGENKTPSIW